MRRVERVFGTKALAFGVDVNLEPGKTHTFVTVWDTSEFDEPCDEGEGGFNNILVSEWDVPEERVIALARQFGIPLHKVEVYETFE
jgi:hypothetical protein